MGTNYYLHKECHHCGQTEEIHIGKYSCGWQFTFKADESNGLMSCSDWMKEVESEDIYDEYGRLITLEDFKDIVYSSKGKQSGTLYGNDFYDSKGWHMCASVFH